MSDEDFIDSEESDPEEDDGKTKQQVREMWKKLEQERGILIFREGSSVSMTREAAHHAKKVLLGKASASVKVDDNWKPRFMRTGLVHRSGLYQLICKDYSTVKWTLRQEIPPLEGTGFRVLKRPYNWDCGPVRISVWLGPEPADPQETLHSLESENPGVGASGWRLVSVTMEEGWRQFVADVSGKSAVYLETHGWTVLYWNSRLPVTRLQNASKQLFINQLAGDNA